MGRRLTFEWDEHNLNHIARHGVSREEFEGSVRRQFDIMRQTGHK